MDTARYSAICTDFNDQKSNQNTYTSIQLFCADLCATPLSPVLTAAIAHLLFSFFLQQSGSGWTVLLNVSSPWCLALHLWMSSVSFLGSYLLSSTLLMMQTSLSYIITPLLKSSASLLSQSSSDLSKSVHGTLLLRMHSACLLLFLPFISFIWRQLMITWCRVGFCSLPIATISLTLCGLSLCSYCPSTLCWCRILCVVSACSCFTSWIASVT